MGPALTIRAVQPGDRPAVLAMAGSEDRGEVRLHAAATGDESLLVAQSGGAVLGVTSIRWRDGCLPPHPWLYGLHVHPSARRRGVGGALVRAAHVRARQHGAVAMTLDVEREETWLVDAYRHLGYEVVGRHRHRWRALDPVSRAVTAEGDADTWLMLHDLTGDLVDAPAR